MYMRIERNKFWGWVVVSLLVGLGIGLAVAFYLGAQSAASVTRLERRLATVSADASDTVAGLQSQMASLEASVTDLAAVNSQLTSDLAAANATIANLKKASSSDTSAAISITSRSVSPSSVSASGTITLTVKVKGKADKVRMQIIGTGGVSYDKMYYLKRVSTSGGVQTWRASVPAPTKKGTYRYYAGAFAGSKKVTMPGSSGWTFQVK